MKITFPHLGNTYLAAKTLFDGLGIEYIIPPLTNQKALEIGSLYSPEEICLPFKIMIGNYIQSIEKGADTILITGSCGPCRFGEYCELQMNILKKLGYNLEFIVIDAPRDIGVKELLNRISKISQCSSKSKLEQLKLLHNAYKTIKAVDDLERELRYLAGYEKHKGECKKLLKLYKEEILQCNGPKEIRELLDYYKNKIAHIEVDKTKKPLKIAIIGEIYTVLEPFSNLYIEDKLMDYGVSTLKMLTPSWWVKNMVLTPANLNSPDIKRASQRYLPLYIGGHAKECIGEAVIAHKKGFDGAIQMLPMGCMPEIVSKSILPTISKDMDFPIMTLVVDEMTGEAGYITRIEAFVDLLQRRNEQNVLSGS